MNKAFSQEIQIHFRQADPAGIVFFAEVFNIAHDVYEQFVQSLGISWSEWFQNAHFAVPLRHTECDFLAPLKAGESYQVQLQVSQLKNSTFELTYYFQKKSENAAVVKTVHTFIDKKSFSKIDIPTTLREKLSAYEKK